MTQNVFYDVVMSCECDGGCKRVKGSSGLLHAQTALVNE
uniref:Uncharacterized protein n=1 Tax=Anguilla anguilla TaxID=7936 RepID=A0A0E9RBS0_ANGAN